MKKVITDFAGSKLSQFAFITFISFFFTLWQMSKWLFGILINQSSIKVSFRERFLFHALMWNFTKCSIWAPPPQNIYFLINFQLLQRKYFNITHEGIMLQTYTNPGNLCSPLCSSPVTVPSPCGLPSWSLHFQSIPLITRAPGTMYFNTWERTRRRCLRRFASASLAALPTRNADWNKKS